MKRALFVAAALALAGPAFAQTTVSPTAPAVRSDATPGVPASQNAPSSSTAVVTQPTTSTSSAPLLPGVRPGPLPSAAGAGGAATSATQ